MPFINGFQQVTSSLIRSEIIDFSLLLTGRRVLFIYNDECKKNQYETLYCICLLLGL